MPDHHAGRRCDRAHLAGGHVGHADLAALEILARPEREGDLAAVRGDGRLALVALVAVVREASRPWVVDADHGQPRRVAALDRDHEPLVAEPDRRAALDE